jgi:hypothetical protein
LSFATPDLLLQQFGFLLFSQKLLPPLILVITLFLGLLLLEGVLLLHVLNLELKSCLDVLIFFLTPCFEFHFATVILIYLRFEVASKLLLLRFLLLPKFRLDIHEMIHWPRDSRPWVDIFLF